MILIMRRLNESATDESPSLATAGTASGVGLVESKWAVAALVGLAVICLAGSGCKRKSRRAPTRDRSKDTPITARRASVPKRPPARQASANPTRPVRAVPTPRAANPWPAQVGIKPLTTVRLGKTKCHIYHGYVAFTAEQSGAPGERIQVKRIPAGAAYRPTSLCGSKGPPYALQIKSSATNLAGLAHHRLILDEGTDDEVRHLEIHDLRTGKQVFRTLYGGAVRHHRGNAIAYDSVLEHDEMDRCEVAERKECKAERRAAFLKMRKKYAPLLDKVPVDDCDFVVGGFLPRMVYMGQMRLDLVTLKRRLLPVVSCTPM